MKQKNNGTELEEILDEINKIDKILVRLKGKKTKITIANIKYKRRFLTKDNTDIKRIIKEHHNQIYSYKFGNLD